MGSDGAAGNETGNSTERMMKAIIQSLIAFVSMFAMPMAMAESATLKAGDPVQIELKAPVEDAAVFGGNYTISESGMVKVPHLNQEISAAGLSKSQLSRKIESAYRAADIYKDPKIIVSVRNSTVGGRSPREVVLRENMRLFQAITIMGGFTEFAKPEVKLIRGKKETKYDVRRIKADGSNNPLLQDGDQIIVPG
jgi:protein involved in polysaccharide export with SLBB domain